MAQADQTSKVANRIHSGRSERGAVAKIGFALLRKNWPPTAGANPVRWSLVGLPLSFPLSCASCEDRARSLVGGGEGGGWVVGCPPGRTDFRFGLGWCVDDADGGGLIAQRLMVAAPLGLAIGLRIFPARQINTHTHTGDRPSDRYTRTHAQSVAMQGREIFKLTDNYCACPEQARSKIVEKKKTYDRKKRKRWGQGGVAVHPHYFSGRQKAAWGTWIFRRKRAWRWRMKKNAKQCTGRKRACTRR